MHIGFKNFIYRLPFTVNKHKKCVLMNYEMQRYKKNSKIKKATFPAAFYVSIVFI
jgi:hypothetical protein